MIQVIRHGNKKRIVCLIAVAYLLIRKQTGVNEFEGFVRCPDCGKECGVEGL